MDPEVSQPDISIRDLEERWGLSRNGLKARAKALGVELIRVTSTLTTWPGQFVELGDQLHEHISSGQPMGTFAGLAPVSDRPVPSRQQPSSDITASNEAALIALADAITASTERSLPALADAITASTERSLPVPDPLVLARRLADAASLGVPLTNSEMATVLGRSTISPKHDGWSPRPGFTIHRSEHNGSPFWTVERAVTGGAVPSRHLAPAADAGGMGFAANLATIDVDVIGLGTGLFNQTRIG